MARSSKMNIPNMSWWFSGALLLSTLFMGFLGVSYAGLAKIDTIEVINLFGQRTMSPDRVKGLTEPYLGQSLSDLDLQQIQDQFLEYPLIRSAKVTKRYPNILDIYLYDILPVAYIAINGIMTLDEKGTLLPLPDNGMLYNLPIITGISLDAQAVKVREIMPDETVQMLVMFLKELRKEYQNIYLDISEVSYDRQGIKLISATYGTIVHLGTEDEALFKSRILSEFVSTESDSGIISPYEYIDLRFDRQVIVKERE